MINNESIVAGMAKFICCENYLRTCRVIVYFHSSWSKLTVCENPDPHIRLDSHPLYLAYERDFLARDTAVVYKPEELCCLRSVQHMSYLLFSSG